MEYFHQKTTQKKKHLRYNPNTGDVDEVFKDSDTIQFWVSDQNFELYKSLKKHYTKDKNSTLEDVYTHLNINQDANKSAEGDSNE